MKIGIVGLGLIGGSLAIAFKQAGFEIIGMSRKDSTCQTALNKNIVDHASTDLSILKDADVIFLCTPISYIVPSVKALIPHLRPETILTDVASVKGEIVQAITPLWKNFIGGHPMAGTAEQGIEAALEGLFVGAPYVLTPTGQTPITTQKTVTDLVQLLHSRLYICEAQVHDQAVAWISHLPAYVSANLIAACLTETSPDIKQMAQSLASSGFRDTSRVGGGNPEMHLMMAQSNRSALLKALRSYQRELNRTIEQIETEDWAAITTQLSQSQQARPRFVAES